MTDDGTIRADEVRRGASGDDGTIVALHFSPVLIAKGNGDGKVRLEPERVEAVVRRICDAEGAEILRSDLSPSHVHLLLAIPPRRSARQTLRRLRTALAHRLLVEYRRHPEDFWALHFWEWEHAAWGRAEHDELEVTRLEASHSPCEPPPTWVSPFARSREGRRGSGD